MISLERDNLSIAYSIGELFLTCLCKSIGICSSRCDHLKGPTVKHIKIEIANTKQQNFKVLSAQNLQIVPYFFFACRNATGIIDI